MEGLALGATDSDAQAFYTALAGNYQDEANTLRDEFDNAFGGGVDGRALYFQPWITANGPVTSAKLYAVNIPSSDWAGGAGGFVEKLASFSWVADQNDNWGVWTDAQGRVITRYSLLADDAGAPITVDVPAYLSYEAKSYDVLRNETVAVTPTPSSEYVGYEITKAITSTNWVEQWSTQGEGAGLTLQLKFAEPVVVSSVVLRQRMMDQSSSMMTGVEIQVGSVNTAVTLNQTEDAALSVLYQQHTGLAWGVQQQDTLQYGQPVISDTLTIRATGVKAYEGMGSDPYENTGLTDLQVYGAILPTGAKLMEESAETATLNVFPPSTIDTSAWSTPSTYDQTTFPADVAGLSLYVDPGGGYDSTKYPVGLEVCTSARLVLDTLAGFMGFPDPSASDSWATQWAAFAQSQSTLNAQLGMSKATPIFEELVKLGEGIQLLFYLVRLYFAGEAGGAGTRYAGSVLLEDSNIGVGGIVKRIKDSANTLHGWLTDTSTLPGGNWSYSAMGGSTYLQLSNMQTVLDRLDATHPTYIGVPIRYHAELAPQYAQMILAHATYTGLSAAATLSLTEPFSGGSDFYNAPSDVYSALQWTALFFTGAQTDASRPQIDAGRWFNKAIPYGFHICQGAIDMMEYMAGITIGDTSFAMSASGLQILKNFSDILRLEIELTEAITLPAGYDDASSPDYQQFPHSAAELDTIIAALPTAAPTAAEITAAYGAGPAIVKKVYTLTLENAFLVASYSFLDASTGGNFGHFGALTIQETAFIYDKLLTINKVHLSVIQKYLNGASMWYASHYFGKVNGFIPVASAFDIYNNPSHPLAGFGGAPGFSINGRSRDDGMYTHISGDDALLVLAGLSDPAFPITGQAAVFAADMAYAGPVITYTAVVFHPTHI